MVDFVAGGCYDSITVSGAEAVQASRMGTFTKLAWLTQGDRPVYQRVGSTVMYLFYWPSTRDWNIGADYTFGAAGVASAGTAALCPDHAAGWQVASGGEWVASMYPITVVRAGAPCPSCELCER